MPSRLGSYPHTLGYTAALITVQGTRPMMANRGWDELGELFQSGPNQAGENARGLRDAARKLNTEWQTAVATSWDSSLQSTYSPQSRICNMFSKPENKCMVFMISYNNECIIYSQLNHLVFGMTSSIGWEVRRQYLHRAKGGWVGWGSCWPLCKAVSGAESPVD